MNKKKPKTTHNLESTNTDVTEVMLVINLINYLAKVRMNFNSSWISRRGEIEYRKMDAIKFTRLSILASSFS